MPLQILAKICRGRILNRLFNLHIICLIFDRINKHISRNSDIFIIQIFDKSRIFKRCNLHRHTIIINGAVCLAHLILADNIRQGTNRTITDDSRTIRIHQCNVVDILTFRYIRCKITILNLDDSCIFRCTEQFGRCQPTNDQSYNQHKDCCK